MAVGVLDDGTGNYVAARPTCAGFLSGVSAKWWCSRVKQWRTTATLSWSASVTNDNQCESNGLSAAIVRVPHDSSAPGHSISNNSFVTEGDSEY